MMKDARKHRPLLSVASLLLASVVLACGESAPPAKEPEPEHEQARPRKSGIKVASELGEIDEAKTKQAFRELSPKFMDCQKARLGAVEVLSGEVKFFVRVGADGSAKYAYVADSDLGDRETEKCLIDSIMAASWPKPDGGEAEVTYAMELPQQAPREANAWSSDRVVTEMGPLEECTGGVTGFRVTMYVVADAHGKGKGGKGGKVVACGVSVPTRDAEAKIDCIVDAAKKLRLPSPGSWPAKVTVKL